MCEHHWLDDPNGLKCVRTDPHEVGHVYESTSSANDKHADGGHG